MSRCTPSGPTTWDLYKRDWNGFYSYCGINLNILIMEAYRVLFQHNKAVTAQRLDHVNYQHLVKLSGHGKKKCMEWLVVTGRNEKDALECANNLVHNFWADYLLVA